MVDNGLV